VKNDIKRQQADVVDLVNKMNLKKVNFINTRYSYLIFYYYYAYIPFYYLNNFNYVANNKLYFVI